MRILILCSALGSIEQLKYGGLEHWNKRIQRCWGAPQLTLDFHLIDIELQTFMNTRMVLNTTFIKQALMWREQETFTTKVMPQHKILNPELIWKLSHFILNSKYLNSFNNVMVNRSVMISILAAGKLPILTHDAEIEKENEQSNWFNKSVSSHD